MKRKKAPLEVLSVSFIVFLLIFVIGYLQFTSHNGKSLGEKEKTLSPDELLRMANRSLDVSKALLNGEITDGPRIVTGDDKDGFKSLYEDFSDPLYIIKIKDSNKEIIVIINETGILKIVPITAMNFV